MTRLNSDERADVWSESLTRVGISELAAAAGDVPQHTALSGMVGHGHVCLRIEGKETNRPSSCPLVRYGMSSARALNLVLYLLSKVETRWTGQALII